MLFQKVQQIYIHLLNMISFPDFIIDKSKSPFQVKYFARLPPTFWANQSTFYNYRFVTKRPYLFLDKWPKSLCKFKRLNILKHIYIVCLHYLPKSYSREPFKQPYPTTCITGDIIVKQNNEKEKWIYHFLISILLYIRKAFNSPLYERITPLYNILYQEDECALPSWG